jgi:hypothetical protein
MLKFCLDQFGFKTLEVIIFFRLPDCWLLVNMHPEGLARRRSDTGFLGFPVSLCKCRDGSQLHSCYCMSCEGRGLCDGLMTRPKESYRVSK